MAATIQISHLEGWITLGSGRGDADQFALLHVADHRRNA
jgi:hypothetical protein